MALPVGSAKATIRIGAVSDIAGGDGSILGLSVRPGCPLVWAATLQGIEPWEVHTDGLTIEVLADQAGVLTSGTVDGAAALVAIRSWPLTATWWTVHAGSMPEQHERTFAAPAAGATVDLLSLPVDGVVPPAQVTYAQTINVNPDMLAALSVGTVTTGAPGSSAAASLTPDGEAYVLDLAVPRGDVGPKGDKGDTGATGAAGGAQIAGDLGGTTNTPTVTSGAHHGHTAAQVSDSTAAGRALLTAADAAAQRAALRVGRSIQITQATPRFGVKNYNDTADFYTLRSVYHVWDCTVMNSGAVYGLSEPSSTGATAILRTLDGGVSWTKLGSVTVSIAGHELLEHIYVEPYYETILVVKNMNTTLNNSYHVLTLDNTCTLKAELDLGANRTWHGGMQNVDSVDKAGSWGTRIIMFSEYTNNNAVTARIMKSEDKGLTWTVALEKGANNGVVNTGQIRHFHCCQVDPFTKHWWAASGDADAQCNIWRSTDEGATWTVILSGDQNARTLGFVFENGYLYYGMDSPSAGGQYQSLIYRVDKTTLVRTQVAAVPAGLAIYMMTRTFYPAGFLVWTADELLTAPSVGVYFFDYHTQELSSVFEFYLGSSGGGVQEASRYQDRETGLVWVKPSSALFRDVYGYGGTSSTLSEILKARLV